MKEILSASPICPDHQNLVHHVLLGRADDHGAGQDEETVMACQTCKAWLLSMEDSEHFREVERGVVAGLTSFRPTFRRPKRWFSKFAIAAGIVALVVGIPLIAVRNQPPIDPIALEVSPTSHTEFNEPGRTAGTDEVISSNGFEDDNTTFWKLGPN